MLVLVFADWYLPGFKAGGPIRSIANMIEALGHEFQFRVITRDRDWLQSTPYPGIVPGIWHRVGKAEVLYLAPSDLSLRRLSQLISAINSDLLYFNSLFSPNFSIFPLLLHRIGKIPRSRVLLAPRGELSPGAVALKKTKKRLSLVATKSIGLYDHALWHASTTHEASDIRSWFGIKTEVMVAPNLAQIDGPDGPQPRRQKVAGELRILFLARISRMKNLDGALAMLHGVKGDLTMNIYGPLEDRDRDYWAECQKLIAQLPSNIRVSYLGSIEHDKVTSIMKEHDLFFLPTLGENFGHVVPEALISGCPVLISDRTPWRDLHEKGVGWALPLAEPEAFRRILQECAEMDGREHGQMSAAAINYGRTLVRDERVIEQNRNMLHRALTR